MNPEMQQKLQNEFEGELEQELEAELENEFEAEAHEHEAHEHEFEAELEHEHEAAGEFEAELENENEFEAELEGAHEFENELEAGELENEFESEFEGEFEGEQFFGKAFKSIGRFVKKNAGPLKAIGRIAAPMVGKAVGSMFGGPAGAALGGKLGGFLAKQLRELEYELEQEFEQEGELEFEGEFEHEALPELESHEALAEAMAHEAAMTEHELEAEAMVGAAVATTLSPRDRRALRRIVPNLVRGSAVLTRILRASRRTRPAVRTVPTIVRRTVKTLCKGAAQGQPITRRRAGQVMAAQTRRVLSKPGLVRSVIARNVRTASRVSPRGGGALASSRRRSSV